MCRTVDTYLNVTKMYVIGMEVVYQVAHGDIKYGGPVVRNDD